MTKSLCMAAALGAALLPLLPSNLIAQKANVRPMVTCPDCDPGDPGDGGGGGGPYVPPAHPDTNYAANPMISQSYGLTWYYQNGINNQMGGVMRRESPAATVVQKHLLIAYVVRQDSYDQTYRPGPIQTLTYDGQSTVNSADYYPQIISSGNPALVSTDPGLQGSTVLAVNNSATGGTSVYIANSSTSFGNPTLSLNLNADYSPSLAYFNNTIYLAVRNQSDQRMTLCTIPFTNPNAYTCTHYGTSRQMNFNPSLAVLNLYGTPTLYIGYEEYNNYHELRLFTADVSSSPAQPAIAESNSISTGNDDQTSSPPSIVAYNGTAYIAFRTNDGDHKFLYRYTTDGTTWSTRSDNSPNTYKMGGSPLLVNGTGLSNTTAQNEMFNLFGTENNPDTDSCNCGWNVDDTKTHNIVIWQGHP